MSKGNVRGSTKLWERVFETGPPSREEMTKAVGAARQDFKVVRWWWYGQPAIDLVKITVDVQPATVGQVFQDIIGVHGQETQITLDAFPYGVPKLDGVRLNVVFERNINPKKG